MALIINSEEIDDELIEGEFRQIKGHYERTLQVACCERDPEFLGYAKENLITRTLVNQAAKQRFPDISNDEIEARLTKLKEEAGGEQQFFIRIGMPFGEEAAIREQVASGVRVDKLLASIYGEEAAASEEELRSYYDSHPEEFMSEEVIHVCHVTKGMEGAKSRAEVYANMRGLRTELLAGADFLTVAERERGNEQQQIDLGWFKRGEFMEEFETIAFSMSEGELSPVFMTPLGFHICKVMARKPSGLVPYDQVKEAVQARVLETARDSKFNAFVEAQKAAATITDTAPDTESGCH
jgi:hypothetical protein